MNHALVLSSPGNQSKMIVCILEFVFVRAGMRDQNKRLGLELILNTDDVNVASTW